jgi:hypothetical protein
VQHYCLNNIDSTILSLIDIIQLISNIFSTTVIEDPLFYVDRSQFLLVLVGLSLNHQNRTSEYNYVDLRNTCSNYFDTNRYRLASNPVMAITVDQLDRIHAQLSTDGNWADDIDFFT